MNGATAADRRALTERARKRLTKILAPDTTLIGARIIAEDTLADLDAAIEIDKKAPRSAPRPGEAARNGL